MTTTLHGGCLCGQTRYELHEEPQHLNDCHCIDCRRSTGAPYVTWGSVRRDRLKLVSGSVRKIAHADRLRSFAACCGTHLFFETDGADEWVDVTIASLDNPIPYPPEKSIWTEDRLPWVILDERHPAFPRSSKPGA